jgi:hypothetical protein
VEECTYFWGVNTSWGIDTAESKEPLHQEDNQAPQPTTLFERTNVVTISLTRSMILQRIGGIRKRVDSKRRDLSHSPTIIWVKVHSWVTQVGEGINKVSHLKVEINQQSRKEKEKRSPRKDLCNVGDVESHTY